MDIKNSISLRDNVTPTLRSIMKALDATYKAMERIDKASDSGSMSKEMQKAENAIKQANNSLSMMSRGAAGAASSTSNIATSAGKIHPALAIATQSLEGMKKVAGYVVNSFKSIGNSASRMWTNLAAGFYIFEKIGNKVSDLMSGVDQLRSNVARANLFSTGMKGTDFVEGAYQIAQNTRSSLEETVGLANKVMLSGVFDTDNAEKALYLTDLINKTLIAGGETQEANTRALLQFNQALASGVMQGDELRSLREQTPYLMKVLAEGLGKVDEKFKGLGIGDLKALGAQGELTSDRIVQAFWLMQDEINASFKTMPKTFGQGVQVLQNFWDMFLYRLSLTEGPLERLTKLFWNFLDTFILAEKGVGVMNGLSAAIDVVVTGLEWLYEKSIQAFTFLSENSEIVATALLTLAAIAGIAASAIIASFVATYAPILIMGAIFASTIWDMFEQGMNLTIILQNIGGAIGQIAGIIVSQVIPTIALVFQVIAAVVAGLTILVGALIGILTVAGGIIAAVVTLVWDAINGIVDIAVAALDVLGGIIVGIVATFVDGILSIVEIAAKAIDLISGGETNFGAGVSGLRSSVNSTMANGILGYKTLVGAGVDSFKKSGTQLTDDWYSKDLTNIGKGMETIFAPVAGAMKGANALFSAATKFSDIADKGKDVDPNNWEDIGRNLGNKLGNKISDAMAKKSETGKNISDWIDKAQKASEKAGQEAGGKGSKGKGGKNNVGTVDKVKKIDDSVQIKDEDIKLLRDMAAREFLLQVSTATPIANITFGDVREEADVNKIMSVLENMVEEQLATSMVS